MVFTTIPATAQDIIYLSKWKSEASRDVVFVESPLQADLCVNAVASEFELDQYPNAWYFTNRESDAKYVFRLTTRRHSNALAVYIYDPPVNYLSSKWVTAYKKYLQK